MADSSAYIFLVTHVVPYPPSHGNELRIYKMLKWLSEEGYRVVLILAAESIGPKIQSELEKVVFAVHCASPGWKTRLKRRVPSNINRALKSFANSSRPHELEEAEPQGQGSPGNEAVKRSLCPLALVERVSHLARKYKPLAVIVEYIFLTPCFAGLETNTLKLIDTIDVFSLKSEQVLNFGIEDPLACSDHEERQHLLRADGVIAIQSREAEILKALVPEREVLLIGIDYEVTNELVIEQSRNQRLTVIASDNALNVHGLREFLANCWPKVKDANRHARLKIIGKAGLSCKVEDSAISYAGWVADLDQVYRDSEIIINPTMAGTGLKVKSAEALAHGKPLVAWTNGVEGLDYEGEAPYIQCNSWEEFGAAIIRLLEDEGEAQALAERALRYARSQFSKDKIYEPLRARLAQELALHHPALANKGPALRASSIT